MGDTLITIIAIFLAAILMFIFPLMSISERNDDVTQLAVQTATSEFVTKAATVGYISQDNYDAFTTVLGATGNTYDIEIEVQHLDENIGKKSITTSGDMIGENVRYSEFTTTILENMAGTGNGKFSLNKGDNVIVTVKNTNTTIAQLLRNFMYTITGDDGYQVAASASSLVVSGSNS